MSPILQLCIVLVIRLPLVTPYWPLDQLHKLDDPAKGVPKIDDIQTQKYYVPADDVSGGSKIYNYIPYYGINDKSKTSLFGHSQAGHSGYYNEYVNSGHLNKDGRSQGYPEHIQYPNNPASLTAALYQPLYKPNSKESNTHFIYPHLYFPVYPPTKNSPDETAKFKSAEPMEGSQNNGHGINPIYSLSNSLGSDSGNHGNIEGFIYKPTRFNYLVYPKTNWIFNDNGNNGGQINQQHFDSTYHEDATHKQLPDKAYPIHGDSGNNGGQINQQHSDSTYHEDATHKQLPDKAYPIHGDSGNNGGPVYTSQGAYSDYLKGSSVGCRDHGVLSDKGTQLSPGFPVQHPVYIHRKSSGHTYHHLHTPVWSPGNLQGLRSTKHYPAYQTSSTGNKGHPADDAGQKLVDDFKTFLSGTLSKTDDAIGHHGVWAYPKETGKAENSGTRVSETSKYPEEITWQQQQGSNGDRFGISLY